MIGEEVLCVNLMVCFYRDDTLGFFMAHAIIRKKLR